MKHFKKSLPFVLAFLSLFSLVFCFTSLRLSSGKSQVILFDQSGDRSFLKPFHFKANLEEENHAQALELKDGIWRCEAVYSPNLAYNRKLIRYIYQYGAYQDDNYYYQLNFLTKPSEDAKFELRQENENPESNRSGSPYSYAWTNAVSLQLKLQQYSLAQQNGPYSPPVLYLETGMLFRSEEPGFQSISSLNSQIPSSNVEAFQNIFTTPIINSLFFNNAGLIKIDSTLYFTVSNRVRHEGDNALWRLDSFGTSKINAQGQLSPTGKASKIRDLSNEHYPFVCGLQSLSSKLVLFSSNGENLFAELIDLSGTLLDHFDFPMTASLQDDDITMAEPSEFTQSSVPTNQITPLPNEAVSKAKSSDFQYGGHELWRLSDQSIDDYLILYLPNNSIVVLEEKDGKLFSPMQINALGIGSWMENSPIAAAYHEGILLLHLNQPNLNEQNAGGSPYFSAYDAGENLLVAYQMQGDEAKPCYVGKIESDRKEDFGFIQGHMLPFLDKNNSTTNFRRFQQISLK